MIKRIDINADMGEGIGNDAGLMPYIDSANISCGYHAGGETTIRTALRLAVMHQVHIGAHISYKDRVHFGRTEQPLTAEELYELVSEQLSYFKLVAEEEGAPVRHVKPHGALYNVSARDAATAAIIARAIFDHNASLILFGLSGSQSVVAGRKAGLTVWQEAFADRRYLPTGQLMSRKDTGSVLEHPEDVLNQVKNITEHRQVISNSGIAVPIEADTICVHGDHPGVIQYAKNIRHYLSAFSL